MFNRFFPKCFSKLNNIKNSIPSGEKCGHEKPNAGKYSRWVKCRKCKTGRREVK